MLSVASLVDALPVSDPRERLGDSDSRTGNFADALIANPDRNFGKELTFNQEMPLISS